MNTSAVKPQNLIATNSESWNTGFKASRNGTENMVFLAFKPVKLLVLLKHVLERMSISQNRMQMDAFVQKHGNVTLVPKDSRILMISSRNCKNLQKI